MKKTNGKRINAIVWAVSAVALCTYAVVYGNSMDYSWQSIVASCILQVAVCTGAWFCIHDEIKNAERRDARFSYFSR